MLTRSLRQFAIKKVLTTAVAALLLLVWCSVAVPAQNVRELHGTVADETGAVIVAASVTLDDGQGHKYSGQTDEKGRYHFDAVAQGTYTLTVSAENFATFTQQVELASRSKSSINITLKVFISEQLEVTPETSAISTEPDKNLSGITLTEKDLDALPDDPDEMLETLREMAGASGSPGDASVYVDGFREGGRLPPKEAILSIRINSNPFAAEFSEPGVSRIEIITKPGTDHFHGGFRFNFNDESLNGRNAFALLRSPLQIRNFSGNFGGPIIRNRWGFFVDIDRREQDENDFINATILDPTTLLPQPFVTTVLTPSRITNFLFRTDYLATKKYTIGFAYRHTSNEATNQGLQGGFDLPERAFNQSSSDNTLRFSLTTIANEHAVNEMRMELSRRSSGAQSLNQAPAILVLDTFNTGGNQGSLFSDNSTKNLELNENLSYTYKKHTIKVGMRADAVQLENTNRSNFGGTFTFGTDFERDASGNPVVGADGQPIIITPLEHYRRTLLGLPGYRPSQFSIVRGDPFVGFSQWQIAWYAQDDWRLSPRLALSYGLRHEFQTHLDDKLNFAPRLGLAWVPDKKRKSTIRVGAGIFYTALDTGITFDTTRLNGQHQQQIVIQRPAFFSDIPEIASGGLQRLSTIRIKAAGLNAPYLIISTVSYERQLPLKLLGSISYSWQRGVHLLRTRNINAPEQQTGLQVGSRPFPDRGPILQFESTGVSTRHELRLTLRTNLSRTFTLFSNYILSSTRSDTDGAYTVPDNSYDLSTEFSRAGFDQRHRFFIGGSVSFPWDVRVSPFIVVASGRPFNITTGRDNNNDTLFADRPAFAGPGDPEAIVTRFGTFNPNPRPTDPIIPRNFGDGPGQVSMNMNFSKTFGFGPLQQSNFPAQARNRDGQQLGARGQRGGFGGGGFGGPGRSGGGFNETRHRYNLTLGVNVQNLLNHTNLAAFNGVLSSPLFGKANRALSARRIELAVRFNF